MAVEIDIEYQGDLHCLATHCPSGETFITDAPVDNGGKGDTFSPTDLVATAQGACVMTIMGLIARENGLDLSGMRARVLKDMVADPRRRIGAIKVAITLPRGKQLSQADRAMLENAAKLCPVKQSLHPGVNVQIDFVYPE